MKNLEMDVKPLLNACESEAQRLSIVVDDIFETNLIPREEQIPVFWGKVKKNTWTKISFSVVELKTLAGTPVKKNPYSMQSLNVYLGNSLPPNIKDNSEVCVIVRVGPLNAPHEILNSQSVLSLSSIGCSADSEYLERINYLLLLPQFLSQKQSMEELLKSRNCEIEAKTTLDKLNIQINSKNNKLSEIEEKLKKIAPQGITKFEEELKTKEERHASLTAEEESLKGKIESAKAQRDLLIQIGLLEYRKNSRLSTEKIDPFTGSFSDLIVHVKSHIASSPKHLIYNDKERIVERFLLAMFTNQIIILSGEPGSGKTSLPDAVAKAIGAECHLIFVQPNWTDNQDLLGFYNPVEKRYVSTPFLEALMAAHKDPERIHFICLDEMNLAHVEYYFSGILSAMETEEKTLSLYVGQTIKELTVAICDTYYPEFSQLEESKREEWIAEQRNNSKMADLVKQWDVAYDYPPEVSIPSNVVFVGTLNMDETTKGISPKVLDRSYIIEICNNDTGEQGDTSEQSAVQARSITPDDFLKLRKAENSDTFNGKTGNDNTKDQEVTIKQINSILKAWNGQKSSKDIDGLRQLQLSKRFLRRQLPAMMEAQNPSMSLSDILAGKILPLMQCDKMVKESRETVEKAFEKECGKDDYAIKKFIRMADDDDSISFWWR